MSRDAVHLISQGEAMALLQGEALVCKHHRHITEQEARRLLRDVSGQAAFEWAILANGSASRKHLVILEAREWRKRRGTMQFVPVNAGGRRPARRGRHVHIRPQHDRRRSSRWQEQETGA